MKSVPTTCPLGMVGGGPHTIATRRTTWHYRTSFAHLDELCFAFQSNFIIVFLWQKKLTSVLDWIIHTILLRITFTERFGAIPGPIFGADESRGPVRIHGETGRTLETDCVVVGEITA